MKYSKLRIILFSMIFGMVFWLADAVYEYYKFADDLKMIMFHKPSTFLDMLVFNIPVHALFLRLIFFIFCIIGGFLFNVVMNKFRKSSEALIESEERYRTLQANLPIGVFRISKEGVLLSSNPALLNIFGCDSEEVLNKKNMPDSFFTNKPKELFWEKLMNEKSLKDFEIELVRKDNSKIWALINITGVYDKSGALVHYDGTIQDISNIKNSEFALIKGNQEKVMILDSLIEHIFYVDRDMSIILANKSACQAAKTSLQKLIGKKCYEANFSFFKSCGNCTVKKCMETGVPEEMEYSCDNSIMKIKAYPVKDEANNITGAISVVLDITGDKKLADERNKFDEQVRHLQKLESLGILAGGIAHDFNNLLMGILGNADLAMHDLNPASSVRANVIQIINASRRAADLCKQMLAYSGKGRFVIEPVNFSELVNEMKSIIEVSVSKKVFCKYNLDFEMPLIDADTTQLRQLIMNLVTNASDAIGNSEGTITITVGSDFFDREYLSSTYIDEGLNEGIYVNLEVVDNGCGMDSNVLSKVFDPFFSTKFTGRGLGMPAVLGIVRGHKGAIKVESEPLRGTKFKILLPAVDKKQKAKPNAIIADDDWHGSGTILLVDDERAVVDVGKKMLLRLGFTVETAENGRQAVEAYKKYKDIIVCVILDLTMPEMNGREAFVLLKEINPGLKIILSSGYNEMEVSSYFDHDELSGFIQKPYQIESLKTEIKKALNI